MAWLFATLHHLAAFALVAALAIELVLIRQELTASNARRLQLVDAALGASAGILLVVGLSRVFYFEKGAAYYFHSVPFIAKLSLFVLIALLSIYPTVVFLSWRRSLKQGVAPVVEPARLRTVPALMARGIGSTAGG